jgi:transglutaminase-like putative cysteine protease
MPRYHVTHRTTYTHQTPVSVAWQSLHLQPRNEAAQHCESFELHIAPHPADLASRFDFFGNKQHFFTLQEPHDERVITSRSVVLRNAPTLNLDNVPTTVGEIPELAEEAVLHDDFTIEQYLHTSPLVPLLPEVRAFAEELSGDLGPNTLATTWLTTVGGRFNKAVTFDKEATQVSTPLAKVVADRRGVCQDFAQLFISLLRQRGIPAGYVSGYLLTRPPAGKPRLVGADASHAWVSAYIPRAGWVDYDPTNACVVGTGHIVVARGRDFSDVSPVKGLFSGGGAQGLETGVTVEEAA